MPTNLSTFLGNTYEGLQGLQGLQGTQGLSNQGVQGLQGLQAQQETDETLKVDLEAQADTKFQEAQQALFAL